MTHKFRLQIFSFKKLILRFRAFLLRIQKILLNGQFLRYARKFHIFQHIYALEPWKWIYLRQNQDLIANAKFSCQFFNSLSRPLTNVRLCFVPQFIAEILRIFPLPMHSSTTCPNKCFRYLITVLSTNLRLDFDRTKKLSQTFFRCYSKFLPSRNALDWNF